MNWKPETKTDANATTTWVRAGSDRDQPDVAVHHMAFDTFGTLTIHPEDHLQPNVRVLRTEHRKVLTLEFGRSTQVFVSRKQARQLLAKLEEVLG